MRRRGSRGGRTDGWRSDLERDVGYWLDCNDYIYSYESKAYAYHVPARNVECGACGNTARNLKVRHYTPDFFFPNGVIIEAKGSFGQTDRRKVERTIKEHGIDLRMLFLRNNLIGRADRTKTRYGDWCDKRSIPWALWPKDQIPREWLVPKN